MSNFDFLKSVNEDLYLLADEAERLFRDEYFEQCITQTRRLAENLCRLVLGEAAQPGDTFDNMLATLKDTPNPSEIEKEFLDDLYFLKKAGNTTVHSMKVKKDGDIGKEALECLERSFEAAINFSVYKCQAPKETLNLVYDEQMLMTGKKSRNASLQERYTAEKKNALEKNQKPKKKKSKKRAIDEYEEYFEIKKQREQKKRENRKPIIREIGETILAGIVIYIAYLLFFE